MYECFLQNITFFFECQQKSKTDLLKIEVKQLDIQESEHRNAKKYVSDYTCTHIYKWKANIRKYSHNKVWHS